MKTETDFEKMAAAATDAEAAVASVTGAAAAAAVPVAPGPGKSKRGRKPVFKVYLAPPHVTEWPRLCPDAAARVPELLRAWHAAGQPDRSSFVVGINQVKIYKM